MSTCQSGGEPSTSYCSHAQDARMPAASGKQRRAPSSLASSLPQAPKKTIWALVVTPPFWSKPGFIGFHKHLHLTLNRSMTKFGLTSEWRKHYSTTTYLGYSWLNDTLIFRWVFKLFNRNSSAVTVALQPLRALGKRVSFHPQWISTTRGYQNHYSYLSHHKSSQYNSIIIRKVETSLKTHAGWRCKFKTLKILYNYKRFSSPLISLNPPIITSVLTPQVSKANWPSNLQWKSESSAFEGFFLAQKLRFGLRISSRDSTKISGRNAMI